MDPPLQRLFEKRTQLTPFVGAGVTMLAAPDIAASSWHGLLNEGLSACQRLVSGLPENWRQLNQERLEKADVTTYLSIADEITRRLETAGELHSWIRFQFLPLKGRSIDLHGHICRLRRLVLTTNYDTLLEEASDMDTVVLTDSADVSDVLDSDDRKAVVHLHGVASRPETIVLGSWQYQKLSENSPAQFWQNSLLAPRHVVFIGCGDGLHDPNIGPALEYVRTLRSAEDQEHFTLVRGRDLEQARLDFHGRPVTPVAYGHGYQDLGPFLERLGKGLEPEASQDPTAYAEDHDWPPRTLDIAGPAEELVQVALASMRDTLRAIGQVERRSALPMGSSTWPLAELRDVHERCAASTLMPTRRLAASSLRLEAAVQDADASLGRLVGDENELLNSLHTDVEELGALAGQASERVGLLLQGLETRAEDTRHYEPALGALKDASESIGETVKILATLVRDG